LNKIKMSAKILLIELPIEPWNRASRMYLPNPGTLSIGTYLKCKGYNVKIIDAYAEGVGWRKLSELIKNEQPDIVGSSSYTPDIYGRILLSRVIKKINPSIVTAFGGSHISLAPEETLRLAKDIDYVVIGEGEETFLELIKALENGKGREDMHNIRGIAYLHNNAEYIRTEARPPIENLDDLPMPDYSMIPMDKYKNTYFPYPAQQGFSCWFSRGCTERCNFCSSNALWQYCWHGRNAKNIVEELKVLNNKYGKRFFLFTDNNFLYDRKRNIEFIEGMKRANLKIEFRPLARIDTLLRDKDLLKDLRGIGLTALQFGVESYDQLTLDGMQKNYKVEQVKELSFYLKEAGIPYTRIFLIVGNYEDNKDSILGLVRKTKECGFGAVQISCLVPWPGTELFTQMKKQDAIKVWDYRRYDWENAIMPTRYLSMKELSGLKSALFYKWYFDISILLRNLSNRYLRHYHFYTICSSFISSFRYKFIYRFKIWKLFHHSRSIDDIYKEHLALIKNR